MAKPNAEPARPSIEAILTDIHNTLVEGFEALHSKLDDIHEALASGPVAAAAEEPTPTIAEKEPAPTPEPKKDSDEIPKFLRAYVEANPEATAEALVKEFKVSINKAVAAVKKYGKKGAAKPAPQKVTVEALRAKISEFAEKFGMNEALAVNEQFGGSRKVSGIPETSYEKVFNVMSERLATATKTATVEERQAEIENSDIPEVTKEDIQKVGGAFVKQYGDPAFRELLAKFVGKGKEPKISQVDPSKYAALHEALSNA